MKKKTAIAGATAVATGVSAGVIGLLSSPAAAVDNVGYECSSDSGANFSTTASVEGTADAEVTVGGQVTLSGVQATVQVDPLLGAFLDDFGDTIEGQATLTVNAQLGDSAQSGSVGGSVGSIPADSFTSVKVPVSPGSISVDATAPGELQFFAGDITATLVPVEEGEEQTDHEITVTCSPTAADAIDVVNVVEETEPTDPPDDTDPQDPGDGDNGPGDDGDNGDGGDDGDNGGDGDNNGGSGGGGDADSEDTANGGGLARTGVDNTVPMTLGGAALVLLGGGLLFYSRRRSGTDDALIQDA